ncbi:hypothetical protein PsYK624_063720 [Phanerochaete sordida]|uniref:Uncharacterized protein n=1 Tax=Phanerochaete sordida TaxID=48140 RepID=A0A9P3G6M2_9APHY|nr:hypothetical protein PsYK624_063720 [Phanerochaete sordida]
MWQTIASSEPKTQAYIAVWGDPPKPECLDMLPPVLKRFKVYNDEERRFIGSLRDVLHAVWTKQVCDRRRLPPNWKPMHGSSKNFEPHSFIEDYMYLPTASGEGYPVAEISGVVDGRVGKCIYVGRPYYLNPGQNYNDALEVVLSLLAFSETEDFKMCTQRLNDAERNHLLWYKSMAFEEKYCVLIS